MKQNSLRKIDSTPFTKEIEDFLEYLKQHDGEDDEKEHPDDVSWEEEEEHELKEAAEKKLEALKAADPVDPKAVKKAEDALKNLSDEKKSRDAVITANLSATLKAAGYPAKADPAKVNKPVVILILTYLVILVTMVYGPIAAMLVEMFPTRIRYTSMSLPYHIGNGWFGGLLPTTAFAIVAQTGNMYNGLWYPIIIAGVTCIIGTLFVKETKDVDIYAHTPVSMETFMRDKFYMGNVISGKNAADVIKMTEIIFGGREAIEKTPATISLINCNSPLRWDDRMLDAQFEYSAAGQAVLLTPFIMMGAMSPVTIPASLVQQIAETLTGVALSQLIRPGSPVIFGSFLSNVDRQSGSPQFGTPESAIGLLCTGQIARHFGLPFRSGGGLNASQTVDAQAGYESLMTMQATFLAGTNFVLHTAGWLEGGLVACYEKFVMDMEILGQLQTEFTPLEIDEKSLAYDSHVEAGHGGHFLGTTHTLENFRTAFYRPFLSSSDNFDRWTRNGAKPTAVRASEIAHKRLAEYEPPPMDDSVKAELDEWVAKRKKELDG